MRGTLISMNVRDTRLIKKRTMTGNSQHLRVLLDFLNEKPIALQNSILGSWYRAAKKRERDVLRYQLTNLVAPDLFVPQNWPPAADNTQKKGMTRLVSTVGRRWLIENLNKHAEKPRWYVQGSGVAKHEFSNPLWTAVARLLETDEIYSLAPCRVCKTFFVKNRGWRNICYESECDRKHNNQLSKERKARQRRNDAAEAIQRREEAEEKAGLLKIKNLLGEYNVVRGFPGGPSERQKITKRLMGFVQRVGSVDEFFRLCSKAEQMVLNKHLYRDAQIESQLKPPPVRRPPFAGQG